MVRETMQQDALTPHADAGTAADYRERCREALVTALERTAMYASWRRLDPGPCADIDARYRALPVLTKDDIRAHFPHGLVPRGMDLDGALRRGEVSYVRTSGTADEALQNIWNQSWWDASERASWKLNSWAASAATGSHREAILASALSVGTRSEAEPIDRAARMLGRFLFLNEYGTTTEWPEGHERRILSELAEYRPPVLEANPSLLARVARWAARHGAEVWQPSLITLTYEFPSALQRRTIRRVFECPVASSYGSTEAGYVFMECEEGTMHQNVDACRVDMVPLPGFPEARSEAPGALGRIVATTFGSEWFPLLRFEIGDVGRVASAPCACGRNAGLSLSSIEGRLKSLCIDSEGMPVTHGRIDQALAQVEGLEQYRLDQESPFRVTCGMIGEPGKGRNAAQGAREVLAALFGPKVDLQVAEVPELHPEKSGKFLLVSRSFPLEEAHRA
jgi:phenylacetate-CoA ligase